MDAGPEWGVDAGLDASTEVPEHAVPDGGQLLPGCVAGDFTAFRGDLHAHTGFSDGDGTPAEAFAYARDVAGLDIMVVTDHLEQLWLGDKWGPCHDSATAATSASFLADCGFEYGTGFGTLPPGPSGHSNVFFANGLFPALQPDFHQYYDSLIACPGCIGQFNHPSVTNWNIFEYHADVDERIHLIEFNGSGDVWRSLFMALDAGWHVSSVYNQDNHNADWGTVNDHRSGFWMRELTRAGLYDAMLHRRTFASADKNASISMKAGQCWMGSQVTGAPQTMTITVEATDSDANDAFAIVELFGPALAARGSVTCGGPSCTATFTVAVTESTYLVARATQVDGDVLVAAPLWLAP